jgi:hypothetical protein
MTTKALVEALDELPDRKRSCTDLAIEALHDATGE